VANHVRTRREETYGPSNEGRVVTHSGLVARKNDAAQQSKQSWQGMTGGLPSVIPSAERCPLQQQEGRSLAGGRGKFTR
jgi:hypothetical protein